MKQQTGKGIMNIMNQISCCNMSKHPHSYTGGSSAATATEMPHSPSPPNVSEEEEEQNESDQQTV
jgi:hypothetical protein